MDAVAGGGARDVGAVVDEDAGRAPARESGRAHSEFVKRARGEIFFAELNQRDARGDAALDECDEACELLTVRSRLARRLAARDETGQRRP